MRIFLSLFPGWKNLISMSFGVFSFEISSRRKKIFADPIADPFFRKKNIFNRGSFSGENVRVCLKPIYILTKYACEITIYEISDDSDVTLVQTI